MSAINYLFPPDQINILPTWRFILHFTLPSEFARTNLERAIAQLKAAEWKIINFPIDLESLQIDNQSRTVPIPIEVTEENRQRINALADYESDFWKVCGNMLENGFGDIFYEAIDWQEG
jgi:hypothetical protein